MSNIERSIEFITSHFASQIRGHHPLPAQQPHSEPFPESLNHQLIKVLRELKIQNLFSHQIATFAELKAGNNVVLAAETASGKTLSFLLPIIDDYLSDSSSFSVILLYPTKALSRDQENSLGRILQATGQGSLLGTFDGDTPQEERKHLQKNGDFILSNPDMLHSGILPNHSRKWRTFLSRLKYIVVDEVHTYRGAYGSHVANVFRRLLRVCEFHGSNPQVVCCSATIGNPRSLAEDLFHKEFKLIRGSGAPRPQRDLYTINPEVTQSHGGTLFRKGPGSVSVPLIRNATYNGVRTICFCRARQEVERLYRAVCDGHPELRSRIKPYRGGLLPNERRQLERDLCSGAITTIITTNALELGIDIGDLSLCILSGHPGTLASFWQQAGRVGRSGTDRAVIVFIARNSPVDQYLVHNPNFLTSKPVEQAWINANNPYILMQHLPCAAQERPLRIREPLFPEPLYQEALKILQQDRIIAPYQNDFRYVGSNFPSRGVNLRGMTDYNIEIYCGTEVIGEIDPIGARGTLYKDAIYQHLGKRFMSLNLDLEKKLCQVAEVDVDYYTEAVWEGRVELIETYESGNTHNSLLRFGSIYVHRQPKLYKKIRERTFENIGYGPITLAPFEYETTGFTLIPAVDWQKEMDKQDRRLTGAALFGLAYLIRRAAPSLCMGDRSDIETDVALSEHGVVGEDRWKNAIFLFDRHEGGVGYAEKIYELLLETLNLCLRILEECECQCGCPACVPTLPPGVVDEEIHDLLIESDAARACTHSLLTSLTSGKIVLPAITTHRKPLPKQPEPEPDLDRLRMAQRLSRAAAILSRKRERLH